MSRTTNPSSARRSAATGIAFALSVLLAFGPLTVSASADASDESLVASIDIDRIRGTIQALEAFGSRDFHLESSRQAAQFLYDELEGVGVAVEMQDFMVGDAEVSNVVGTLQGSDEEAGMYLFGAHYDSENRDATNLSTAENLTAPGADDDASGVAAVLEMARVLKGAGFPGTVKFVMFGAEEMGYDGTGCRKGSEHYAAAEAALGSTYAGTAVLDMIGYRDGSENRAVIIVDDGDNALASMAQRAVGDFGIDLRLDMLVAPSIVYSDHSSFWAVGIPSMLVIEELDDIGRPLNPYYHTSGDTVDTLSLEQALAVTQALMGGLLLSHQDGEELDLVFGIVLMSAVTVSVALFIYIRRRRGRSGHDG